MKKLLLVVVVFFGFLQNLQGQISFTDTKKDTSLILFKSFYEKSLNEETNIIIKYNENKIILTFSKIDLKVNAVIGSKEYYDSRCYGEILFENKQALIKVFNSIIENFDRSFEYNENLTSFDYTKGIISKDDLTPAGIICSNKTICCIGLTLDQYKLILFDLNN